MTRRWSVLLVIVLLAALAPATALGRDPAVGWTRQFGTGRIDGASDIAVTAKGRIVVVGWTDGTFPGQTRRGGRNTFMRKYGPRGSVAWTRQFSSARHISSVTVNGKGRVYVAGGAYGTFHGRISKDEDDAFVRKYLPDGSVAWTRRFGTREYDHAYGVTVDRRGRVYVAGSTGGSFPGQTNQGAHDAFVRKYRPDGSVAWTRQFGSRGGDYASSITVDSKGRIVVAGHAGGTFPGQTRRGSADAFVRMYRPDGRVVWTRQFGTSAWDTVTGVAVDSKGRVYVAGQTRGTFPGQTKQGHGDVFVRKYRPDGRVVWTRQFGTSAWDTVTGVTVDSKGRVYVAGKTRGTFPGQTREGEEDAFVRMYRPDGRVVWTEQFGSARDDVINGIAVDGSGRIAVAGSTMGILPGQTSEGSSDAFVRTYVQS